MQDNPEDFHNECTEFCNDCNSDQLGMEMYANDAMGMATPVLWLCNRCENPPVLVGLYRKIKIKVSLRYSRVRYEFFPELTFFGPRPYAVPERETGLIRENSKVQRIKAHIF